MDFVPSQHQAAGHDGCLTAGPVFAKLTTQQEIDFYTATTARTLPDAPLGAELAHWMPAFMGTLTQGAVEQGIVDQPLVAAPETVERAAAQADKQYIVLENLYDGFENPCILDIKLGAVLVDDSVSEEKRQRLANVSAATTSGLLHFRVCGMKTYCGQSTATPPPLFDGMDDTVKVEHTGLGNYVKYNKFFGRALNERTVVDGIAQFFSDDVPLRRQLLTRFHQRLQLLYNCLLDAEVRIKSGSLFFIYEGSPQRWLQLDEDAYFDRDPLVHCADADDDDDDAAPPLSRLGFIDFAHSTYADGDGPDENVVVGVENLIDVFGTLVLRAS